MSNSIKAGRTVAGRKNYTVTVGATTFVRTDWNAILDILRELDNVPTNAGYGTGVYSGD